MKNLLTWLKEQAAHRSFLSNTLMLAGGTLAGQVFLAVMLPILTRLYRPSEIGLFGIYLSFIGLASVATTLKFAAAIVSAKDLREAAYLGLAGLTLCIPISLLFSLLLFLLTDNALLGFEALPAYSIALAFPTLFLIGTSQCLRFWFIRNESFGVISAEPLLRNIAKSLVQIVLGWLNPVGLSLITGETVGRLSSVAQLFSRFRSTTSISELLTPLKWRLLLRILHSNRKFPLILFPSSLIEALALGLPLPLIGYGYGLEAAGFFSLAQQVVTVPLGFFGRSFADVFHGRIAAQARADGGKSEGTPSRQTLTLFAIGIGPALVLMLVAEELFRLVFGEAWAKAGVLASLMAPWAFAQLLVVPLSRVVLVFNRQELKFLYDVCSLVGVVVVLSVGIGQGLPLLTTVAWLSLVQTLLCGFYFLILRHAAAQGMGLSKS